MKRSSRTRQAPEKRVSEPRRAVLIGVVGLGVIAAIGVSALRDSTPVLVRAEYERADKLWARQGFDDYTITVSKEADALGTERVVTEVRDRQVVSLRIDDQLLPPQQSYTVKGLLDTIGRELEMAGEKRRLDGQPQDAILKARFDHTLGLPTVFKRLAGNRKSFVLRVEELRVPGQGIVFAQ